MAWEQESKRHSIAAKFGQAGSKKTSISPLSSSPSITSGASKVFTSAKGVHVSEKEFEAYVKVQMSGVTNMFDVNTVSSLSGLDRDVIFAIMDNYEQLDKMFPHAKHRVDESEDSDDSHATNDTSEEKMGLESLGSSSELEIEDTEVDEDKEEEKEDKEEKLNIQEL